VAMSASMAGGPVLAPAVAAAEGGHGATSSGVDVTAGVRAGSSKVVLELGNQGALVAAAQRRLNEVLPFSHLAVDGIFGPLTQSAVLDFQRRHGLVADGKLDVGTWAKLFDAPVLVFGAAGDRSAARPASNRSATGVSRAGSDSTEFAILRHSSHRRARSHHAVTQAASSTVPGGGAGGQGGESPAANGSSQGASEGGGPAGGGTSISVVAPPAPTTQPSTYVLTDGVALPLPRQYITNGYVDQGVDYAAPGGTPEYAMGDGVIIGEGISGFGPNAPILKITSGPLKGLEVYYGHSGADLVHVGDHVKAGQQITEVGYGIVGISTGPHLEIGFYPPGPRGSGSRMLAVINALLRQHPRGRAWSSAASTAHVARDTQARTTSTNSIAFSVPTPRPPSSSSSGGAAVGSNATSLSGASPASAPVATTPSSSTSAPTSASTGSDTSSAPATTTATPLPAPAASAQPSSTATAVPASAETTATPTAASATAVPNPAPSAAEPSETAPVAATTPTEATIPTQATTSTEAATSTVPDAAPPSEAAASTATVATPAATTPSATAQTAPATDASPAVPAESSSTDATSAPVASAPASP
jgi:murein DD-endopeptidase MepM/ murein hydrolase activator NlpD